MQRTKSFLISSILLAVLVGMFLTSGAARAASSAPKITCGQWNYVSSPSLTNGGFFNDVAAISSTDAWAVGWYYDSNNLSRTLIEQWNGTSWSIIPSPNQGNVGDVLNGVAAVSSTDVWAVGGYEDSNYLYHTLVEQWNGTSWSIIPSPDKGTYGGELSGIAALSATNIWAVGNYDIYAGTLVEHWNGSQWSIVPSKSSIYGAGLNSIAALSAKNVWAVGFSLDSSRIDHTLIEHWNGTKWKTVTSPNITGNDNFLNSVAVISGKDVWADGESSNSSSNTTQTLIEQWNGTQWSIVASPNPSSTFLNLSGMAAVSSTNIWAVGFYQDSSFNTYALIEKWNGTQWNIVPISIPEATYSTLSGVARIPGTSDLWSVGTFAQYSGDQTLTAYYC